ncbi:MAG: SUMF1/EgtB/PvdO family nonheme iron enzyme [Magnetococcales bacterium]|nr:SUMF1/EgtB/PvdO family nonheme iron enzyme [Magnetococcales bacterium]
MNMISDRRTRMIPLALTCAGMMACSLPASAHMIDEWERLDSPNTEKKVDEAPVPGKSWTDSLTGIRFVWIPGGCFAMGSPPWKEYRENDEGPVHQVCVSDYWLSDREVTQGQWQAVMRINPSAFPKGDNYPLEQVSWIDAEVVGNNLNARFQGQARFRLPTEAEWEYACREGGDDLNYAGRADLLHQAWYADNSHRSTQPTATRKPNRLGLYDMSGNVWEWTADSYHPDSYHHRGRKPPGTEMDDGQLKAIRGGGWKDGPGGVRCAGRGFERATVKRSDLGFRLAAVVGMAQEGKRPQPLAIPF